MKNTFIPLFLSSTLILANNLNLSWVDQQVEAIKPPRDGESVSSISKIKDPFIFTKKTTISTSNTTINTSKTEESTKNINDKVSQKDIVLSSGSFILGAIINESALINNKWYKVGETVNGYKILKINQKTVSLKNASGSKVLTTKTENTKLKFKDR